MVDVGVRGQPGRTQVLTAPQSPLTLTALHATRSNVVRDHRINAFEGFDALSLRGLGGIT
jgi:hypothetical protein